MTMETIEIYTDGGSLSNGKPTCTGGWATCIPNHQGMKIVRYGFLDYPSSNNKAELAGVLVALKMTMNLKGRKVVIHSDSQYAIGSLTTWAPKRRVQSGYKNEPMITYGIELMDTTLALIEFKWVRGHTGVPGNEMADLYAGLGNKQQDRTSKSDKHCVKYHNHQQTEEIYGFRTRYENA